MVLSVAKNTKQGEMKGSYSRVGGQQRHPNIKARLVSLDKDFEGRRFKEEARAKAYAGTSMASLRD